MDRPSSIAGLAAGGEGGQAQLRRGPRPSGPAPSRASCGMPRESYYCSICQEYYYSAKHFDSRQHQERAYLAAVSEWQHQQYWQACELAAWASASGAASSWVATAEAAPTAAACGSTAPGAAAASSSVAMAAAACGSTAPGAAAASSSVAMAAAVPTAAACGSTAPGAAAASSSSVAMAAAAPAAAACGSTAPGAAAASSSVAMAAPPPPAAWRPAWRPDWRHARTGWKDVDHPVSQKKKLEPLSEEAQLYLLESYNRQEREFDIERRKEMRRRQELEEAKLAKAKEEWKKKGWSEYGCPTQ